MLHRLGGIIYRAKWAVLLGGMALVVAAAIFGAGVFGTLKSGGFQDPNSQSTQAQTLLDQRFGGAASDVVLLMQNNTLKATDPAFVSAATALLDTLKARSEVASVTSYYSTHSASFLSRDGHETFAVVQLAPQDETAKETDYKALQPLLTSSTLNLTLGGNVVTNIAVSSQISADLEHAEIITFPIVGFLLFLVFGGLVAALPATGDRWHRHPGRVCHPARADEPD